jgi:hypothetical protein
VARHAAARVRPHPGPAATADPFSLADPATVDAILTAAGFTDVDIIGVHETVYYGADPASALDALLTLRMTQELLATVGGEQARTTALDTLRSSLAARQDRNGVNFESSAWLITARRGA